ncbi:SDR family NAD(P)-dependent oxidoreductase [Streptomyces sp. MJP52]|uniref:SDR family NAD(P)-dependent oxidoreductase n=1 Tax=Streptomyces sp. MJP52 TaxID=2940555 RepID=UPI002473E0EE|nr:SDR family NAD(P)-dependent oxidoreductase [Streptomyces sp. MJP52]MDH6223056.1 NAD(P)-dependent dehydrogenase (short-subunit alcohol dehydrogenase family) [Streptomyces sp. MJP52]
MGKVWFITGASRGFGRCWAEAAVARGDRVAVAARSEAALRAFADDSGDAVLPLPLDITDRAAVFAAVQRAHAHFGRLDVVVNNAGVGHIGCVEEVTEHEARAVIETNILGTLAVTQAALPLLRAQGGGHLIQVSSSGGIEAYAGMGLYCATKWAVEGMSEALAEEVASFGIRVTVLEPGGYATGWFSAARRSASYPAYAPLHDLLDPTLTPDSLPPPEATVPAVLALVDSVDPPRRLPLGSFALRAAVEAGERRLDGVSAWDAVIRAADGIPAKNATPPPR